MAGVVQVVRVGLCVLLCGVWEVIVVVKCVDRVDDELVHSATGAALGQELLAVRDARLLRVVVVVGLYGGWVLGV